tara:strand:+ start:140 stop:451 length:312 start_codon:yes stop_codon:yes gene_type:complete
MRKRKDLERLNTALSKVKNPPKISGSIKAKSFYGKDKQSFGLSTSKIPLGSSKMSFGLGIDKIDKKGYDKSSFTPSAKVKLNVDINKLYKKHQKKKQKIKFKY